MVGVLPLGAAALSALVIAMPLLSPIGTCAPAVTWQAWLPVWKSLSPQRMVVSVLVTAMLTAALDWFHFEGQVACGMQ